MGAGSERKGLVVAALAGAVALLSKGKSLLVLAKAGPLGAALLSTGSMVVSAAAFAWSGGWAFGIALVAIILVHELGHGAAMRAEGLRPGWPIFIPFFGAAIQGRGRDPGPVGRARIAWAGPLAGGGAALLCATLGQVLDSRWWLSLAGLGFGLNLLNLLPFAILDGARVAALVERRAWVAATLAALLAIVALPSGALLLFAGLGVVQMFRGDGASAAEVPLEVRRHWARRYFGLGAVLGFGAWASIHLARA